MTAELEASARVVVVDDDRLIRELVSDAIQGRARVECCDSGESALEALRREPAELVISDLTMPGMSGVELLEEIRRTYPGTDFVLLTGNASVESAVEALRMGAADYLTKPIIDDDIRMVGLQLRQHGHRCLVIGRQFPLGRHDLDLRHADYHVC